MSDLINRQDTIRVIKRMRAEKLDSNAEALIYRDDACNRLRTLPPAAPEQKKGKWIIRDNPGTGWYRVTCSECGEDVTSTIPMIGFFPNAKPLWDYCPYCGTKMEAEG